MKNIKINKIIIEKLIQSVEDMLLALVCTQQSTEMDD